MMNGQNMMDCMGAMGAMGWVMGLFWTLLLALPAWGLYRLFTTSGSPRPPLIAPGLQA